METTEKKALLSPMLIIFMVTMVIANIAAQMNKPLEPLYVQELGASVKQIGLFFTLAAIAPLFLQILGGWLSDSLGRLKAIALGSLGGVMGYVVYILAPSWEWLLIGAVSTAMAYAFVGPSFQAYVAEESTEDNRGRVYGITNTMFALVQVIGPLVGGIIAQGLNFKTLFIAAGCLYSTAAIIRILMARYADQKQKRDRASEMEAEPENGRPSGFAGFKKSTAAVFGLLAAGGVVTWIFISDGVRDVSFGLTGQLMPVYLENIRGLTLVQIGSLQSITAAVAMMFMIPAGWLSDKKGERVGIVGGFAIIVVSWVIFLLGRTFLHFAISNVFVGIGWALIAPAYDSLISKAVPENLRGMAFGLFNTSRGIISLPMPWIGAQLWAAFTPLTPFYVPLVAMIAMLPVMWVKFKLPDNGKDEAGGDVVAAEAAAD